MNKTYRGWLVSLGVYWMDAPQMLSSCVSVQIRAIRKYLYGVPRNPRR